MSGATLEVVGFGAAALDIYLPVGNVGEDHVPGEKIGWTDHDQKMLAEYIHSGEQRVGGNVFNALAYLGCQGADVTFASVLGKEGDEASDAIRAHAHSMGITNHSITVGDYEPSISVVERLPGRDRMIRGRPRSNMLPHMTVGYISSVAAGAQHVMVASLKNPDLNDRVFANIPGDTRIGLNPGSSEFKNHPDRLLATMRNRNAYLLSLNETELAELYQSDADPRALAVRANELATYVLCTMGEQGMLLAHNGDLIHHKVTQLPKHEITDTTGAGDRANAVAYHGLMLGKDGKQILHDAELSTRQVIKSTGAHADLYTPTARLVR